MDYKEFYKFDYNDWMKYSFIHKNVNDYKPVLHLPIGTYRKSYNGIIFSKILKQVVIPKQFQKDELLLFLKLIT